MSSGSSPYVNALLASRYSVYNMEDTTPAAPPPRKRDIPALKKPGRPSRLNRPSASISTSYTPRGSSSASKSAMQKSPTFIASGPAKHDTRESFKQFYSEINSPLPSPDPHATADIAESIPVFPHIASNRFCRNEDAAQALHVRSRLTHSIGGSCEARFSPDHTPRSDLCRNRPHVDMKPQRQTSTFLRDSKRVKTSDASCLEGRYMQKVLARRGDWTNGPLYRAAPNDNFRGRRYETLVEDRNSESFFPSAYTAHNGGASSPAYNASSRDLYSKGVRGSK